jgi:hypothetical protein
LSNFLPVNGFSGFILNLAITGTCTSMFSLQPLEVVSGGRLDHRLSLPGRKPTSPANLLGKQIYD